MSFEYWRKDFWNDPDLWDGLDTHRDMCWMHLKRRRDVIDARPVEVEQPAPNPYANALQQPYSIMPGPYHLLQNPIGGSSFQNVLANNIFGRLF